MKRVWSLFRQGLAMHSIFARLHGMELGESSLRVTTAGQSEELRTAYAEYAAATTRASEMLQKHGPSSPEFTNADVVSMRLFHRVKKMQGLRKPGKAA